MDLWADTQTRLPVKVELNLAAPNAVAMRLTMTDFSWNAQPPAQLSLTPPDGYTVVNMSFNFTLPTEQEFTAALGQWAQLNGGRFPDSIEPTEVDKLMSLKDQPGHTDADLGQAMVSISRALLFKSPTNGSDWHYVGKGVALGQGDTPILWYHPVNSQAWRIIDASLKARPAGPQDLLKELPQAQKR